MRTSIYHLFICLVSLSIFCSCSSSKSTTNSTNYKDLKVVDTGYGLAFDKDVNQSNETINPNEKVPSNLTLADMLRSVSGVSVTGQGNNVRIRVHGTGSFGPTDPLYVLNGTAIGTDYVQVAGIVNSNDISSLRVLKGPEASIYGSRGGNGVILIRTKLH